MTFEFRKVFNRGTKTPAVARTGMQGAQIIDFFQTQPEKKAEAKDIVFDLMAHLIGCVEIAEDIDNQSRKTREDMTNGNICYDPKDQVRESPTVINLRGKVESFLHAAKLAITDSTRLLQPFYGVSFNHNLNKLRAWANNKYGRAHRFVVIADRWEPFVKYVLLLRNAVDHPKSGRHGYLHVENFHFLQDSNVLKLIAPLWRLEGEGATSVANDMFTIIGSIVQLHEELIVALFYEQIGSMPLMIEEISESKRDQNCPIRLKVTLRQA